LVIRSNRGWCSAHLSNAAQPDNSGNKENIPPYVIPLLVIFDDEEEAAQATDKLARSVGVPEHKLNFPNRHWGAFPRCPMRAQP
jgi:hypothetical protein